jgi:ankyrin repeat protein
MSLDTLNNRIVYLHHAMDHVSLASYLISSANVAKTIHLLISKQSERTQRSKPDLRLLEQSRKLTGELERALKDVAATKSLVKYESQLHGILSVLLDIRGSVNRARNKKDLLHAIDDLRSQKEILSSILASQEVVSTSSRAFPRDLSRVVQEVISTDTVPSKTDARVAEQKLLGLTQLHTPTGEADTDILFVHGLNGHARETWTGASSYWPQDFLSKDFSNCRILTYGYDTSFSLQKPEQPVLDKLVDDFLQAIRLTVGRRIIFIAHSLGGILVKAALTTFAREQEAAQPDTALANARIGLIFLGTPHSFSSFAARISSFRSIITATSRSSGPSSLSLLASPESNASAAASEFKLLVDRKQIPIFSFFETQAMLTDRGALKTVESFTQLHHPRESIGFLTGNHVSMCKFDSDAEEGYLQITNAIKQMIEHFNTPHVAVEEDLWPLTNDLQMLSRTSESGKTTELDIEKVDASAEYSKYRRQFDVPLARFRSARTQGATEGKWILETPTLKSWLDAPSSKILLISGPGGCGKSMAAESILEHLQQHGVAAKTRSRSCFIQMFFRFDSVANQDLNGILEAFIAQLLDQNPDLVRHLPHKLSSKRLRDPVIEGTLLAILRLMLGDPCWAQMTFVIDALDECSGPTASSILDFIRSLMHIPWFRAILTTRRNVVVDEFLACHAPDAVTLDVPSEPVHSSMIKNAIRDQCLSIDKILRPLRVNESAKESVLLLDTSILQIAGGSFTMVKLVLQYVQNSLTRELSADTGILLNKTLTWLTQPRLFENLCLDIMKWSRKEEQPTILRSLPFLACAFEPLRANDLEMLLSLGLHRPESLEGAMFNLNLDLASVIKANLGGLVRVDGEGIHLASSDIQHFVLSNLAHWPNSVTDQEDLAVLRNKENSIEIHLRMARACLHILLLCHQAQKDDDSHVEIPRSAIPGFRYADRFWSRHLRNAGPRAMELDALVFEYLRSTNNLSSRIQSPASLTSDLLDCLATRNLSFNLASMFRERVQGLDYPDSTDLARVLTKVASSATVQTLEALRRLHLRKASSRNKDLSNRFDMIVLLQRGQRDELEVLLRNCDLQAKQELLKIATQCRRTDMIGFLLTYVDSKFLVSGEIKIIELAIEMHNRAAVALMASKSALFNLESSLRLAASSADGDICEILLSHGAMVNDRGKHGESPLHIAARTGQRNLVMLMLKWRAQPSIRDDFQRTPLHCAAEYGRTDVVSCLLSVSALTEETDQQKRTPLFIACALGRKSTARFLWSSGANLLHRDNIERTTLHAAAQNGSDDIVQLLISAGCPTQSKDRNGKSPLHYAASRGWVSIVSKLIAAGEKIEAVDKKNETILHAACRGKNAPEVVIEKLLDQGADVDASSSFRKTPLHLAAEFSNIRVVRLLLDNNANVSSKDSYGYTPLDCAMRARDAAKDKKAKEEALAKMELLMKYKMKALGRSTSIHHHRGLSK